MCGEDVLQAPVTNKCTLNSSLQGNLSGSTGKQHDKHQNVNKTDSLQPSCCLYFRNCGRCESLRAATYRHSGVIIDKYKHAPSKKLSANCLT